MDKQELRAPARAERMRVAEAREALAEAVADVRTTALNVDAWDDMGSEKLPQAAWDLAHSTAWPDKEANARRVSEAFTVDPGYLYSKGIDNLAFGTAVQTMRLALNELDAALGAVLEPE
ncbi:hypothetical protein [Streptomyces collinus]|uniref:Uncharacterized protein n=1 Tax=Streptomyces collinus (strain DSM 40733 / Tue 365) TaxID=1214242 RepID=S5UJ98_STRC3|nr:hypothetical protein [Streptomyces collinus]AGS66878.1 hypothetical protein B446_00180 [Streptomyces collinus Tu 365]AGS73816.1 hypothetical protein B446_35110 [Streptomyces collinus Tu 365]